MKNLKNPWLGLLILLFCVRGFAQGPPAIPTYWPLLEDFEFPTNFLDLDDYPPVKYTNIYSWGDESLVLDTTNTKPAYLEYNVVEVGGHTNIDFSIGTLWFVFAPNWASADTNQHGTGPGTNAYLMTAGDATSNAPQGSLRVYFDAHGTNIHLGGLTNGVATNYVTATISWASNSWHSVDAEYTSSNSAIYLDGNLAATGVGVALVPPTNTWTNGMFIGSDAQGYEQMRGVNWWTEDWNVIFGGANGILDEWISWSGLLSAVTWWQDQQGGWFAPMWGGGFNGFGGLGNLPNGTVNTNFAAYTNFWLTITNASPFTAPVVTIENTLSNLTYVVLTNSEVNANLTNWGVWQVCVASNAVTTLPAVSIGTNQLYFNASLVLVTGTNNLPDWWQMEYFHQLNVNPYADPDGDGLCNYSEYVLGTNPTNANSISGTKNDAQALFLAYTNDSSTVLRLFQANGPGTNSITLTLSNTLVGSNYQIYSKDLTTTNSAWRVETSFVSTNDATKVVIALNGRTLGFIGGDGSDDDGDGLPDGYEVLATLTDPLLADTGNSGTPDGYKDPDGDSYVNLEEYYNGTDPHVFNTPPGVPASISFVSGSGSDIDVTWQAANGPVTGYIVYGWNWSLDQWVAAATNTSTQLSYLAGPSALNTYFAVQATYAGGLSAFTYTTDTANYNLGGSSAYTFPVAIVNGPSNRLYLVASGVPPTVTNFIVTRLASPYETAFPIDSGRWQTPTTDLPAVTTNGTFSIPIGAFTNGMALLPTNEVPLYGAYLISVQAFGTGGNFGRAIECWGPTVGGAFQAYGTIPFIDGSASMKNNIAFLMSYVDAPLSIVVWYTNYYDYVNVAVPQNYVYSSYITEVGGVDQFLPFEDNWIYNDFQWSPSFVGDSDYLPWLGGGGIESSLAPTFPTYSYVVNSNSAPIPPALSMSTNQWFASLEFGPLWQYSYPAEVDGVSQVGNDLYMSASEATNLFAVPLLSLQMATWSNTFDLLTPSTPVLASNVLFFYADPLYPPYPDNLDFAASLLPKFQTVGYYFARISGLSYASGSWANYPVTVPDPTPGNFVQSDSFSPSNTTPLMITEVGQLLYVAGYAVQTATNCSPSVPAYLGQYFTNALLIENGTLTTNVAGIVSEYGSFFATVPGEVGLMTKPDASQGNMQGECIINVLGLCLDGNHDGVMDQRWNGADMTTAAFPYQFWINNDYDRWTSDVLDGTTPYEDDLSANDAMFTEWNEQIVADCNFYDVNNHRAIPCPRDLEDFARLWVSGVTTNLLASLPSGSQVTLNWGDVGSPNSGNPTIDIFQAADTNGGVGYLTNLVTASNQINNSLCKYVGRLGPGSNIVLNSSTFSNGWAGNYFVWCGVSGGSGQLFVTISNASGTILAQASQFIQIQDIKQMYERWTVGDNDDNKPIKPLPIAIAAGDDISPGAPSLPFQYPYNAQSDTNDDYIVFVHGFNMPVWEKDRWAETAYKRLYWQGYQGRFGLFRWPCYNVSVLSPQNYDLSESNAWASGQPLETFLTRLNILYPGKVYVMAHSQGNVVVGEALRLATNQLVNTYVASQAAVSARAYDNSVPTNVTSYYSIRTSDPQGHYYTNGAAAYFASSAGAGTYINYYNANDYALMGDSLNPLSFHPGWLFDQSDKPDSAEYYYYTAPTGSIPSGFFRQVPPYNRMGASHPFEALNYPTNTYEIFAMGAQSYSLALGAQTNVGTGGLPFSLSKQVNLSGAPFNFGGAHIQHDEEFVFDNMSTQAYWTQLLFSFDLTNRP